MAKTKKQAALNEIDPDRRAAAWEITKRAQAAALSDRREGHKLAITMLRELELSPELCDLCALDEFVTGRATPQDNIVLRCLEKCRERSPSAEAGFCAVLSDMVAVCSEGFVPNAATYQKVLKIRVPGRVSKETERLRTWKSVQRITGRDYGPMPPDWGKPPAAKESTHG